MTLRYAWWIWMFGCSFIWMRVGILHGLYVWWLAVDFNSSVYTIICMLSLQHFFSHFFLGLQKCFVCVFMFLHLHSSPNIHLNFVRNACIDTTIQYFESWELVCLFYCWCFHWTVNANISILVQRICHVSRVWVFSLILLYQKQLIWVSTLQHTPNLRGIVFCKPYKIARSTILGWNLPEFGIML